VPRIVIIAGEASGDQLGRGLIEALRQHYPDAQFEGITGGQMRDAGCDSWADYEQLAVMGLFEVLRHLPRLLRLKKSLEKRLRENPPDVLIGIDAPDFNLRLEKFARGLGIPTVHYVCPSVWAWRPKRVKYIREACDLVLCLLPFERDFVVRHGVNARFVGHPLADEIQPRAEDGPEARAALGLQGSPVVALLPGSRVGELNRLGSVFLEAASWLREQVPGVRFVSAAATRKTGEIFSEQCHQAGLDDAVKIVSGQARQTMAAADVVLLASGTATLEAMLMLRPMVVAYKVAPLSAWLARAFKLINIRYFSMPNLLAGYELVPEFIQERVTGAALGRAVLEQLQAGERREQLLCHFGELGDQLRQSASAQAAIAVADLLASREQESLPSH
jgi:lipid-A-disaccharide synthase